MHAQKEACAKIPVYCLVYRITERIIRYRISQIQSIRLSSSSSKVLRRTKGGGLLGIGGRLRPKELERFTMAGRVRCGVKPLEGPPLPTIGLFPVIPRLKQTNISISYSFKTAYYTDLIIGKRREAGEGHTGISTQIFFHSTIIAAPRMSLVSRIGKIQGTGICLIGALFFSNNGIKNIIKNYH